MKHKVYVIVSVPIIEKEYDMYLPVVKKIGAVKKIIIDMISKESDNNFIDDGTKHLYLKKTGEILDDNIFVKYSDIKNGTKLILY